MDNKLVILVVEDDVPMQDVLLMFLKSFRDVTIWQATDFNAALSLTRTSPRIDLLLCDVHLRGTEDGIHLADYAVAAHPHVAVVLLSADEPDYVRPHSATYAYIQKPFDRHQLTHHIDAAFLNLRTRLSVGKLSGESI